MKLKQSRREVRSDNTIFVTGGAKQPIQSPSSLCTAEITEKQMQKVALKQPLDGLAGSNQSQLPGKYIVWCYHFTLYKRMTLPLKMCEIPSFADCTIDREANLYNQKWLGCIDAFLALPFWKECTTAETQVYKLSHSRPLERRGGAMNVAEVTRVEHEHFQIKGPGNLHYVEGNHLQVSQFGPKPGSVLLAFSP